VCEALLTSDKELWKSAVEEEYKSLFENETDEVQYK
jgi:hypothetical protein